MSCEICGRSSCTKVFHSLDEQREFDDAADKVKDRLKSVIINKVKRINSLFHDGYEMEMVCLDDVINAINDAD